MFMIRNVKYERSFANFQNLLKRTASRIVTLIALAMLSLLWQGPATAQTALNGNVRKIVVALSAGGTGDRLGRLLARQLNLETGRTYIVENKPGAGGNIAAEYVAHAPNDGSVLLMVSGGLLTINPYVFRETGFDASKDFTYIAKFAETPNILFVNAQSPYKTLKEMVEGSKANPAGLNFGTAGVGSSTQIAGELLRQTSGAKFTDVPYKGGEPATRDLAAGQLDIAFSTTVGQRLMEAGKLRALAVASKKRLPSLPNIPTFGDAGYKDIESTVWFGVVGPAGMDKKEIAIIEKAVRDLSIDPKIIKDFEAESLVMDFMGPDEFRSATMNEAQNMKSVIEALHIPKQ
jgi:tripartite-type tricarboxylate transporter receptor subunit TctC